MVQLVGLGTVNPVDLGSNPSLGVGGFMTGTWCTYFPAWGGRKPQEAIVLKALPDNKVQILTWTKVKALVVVGQINVNRVYRSQPKKMTVDRDRLFCK